MFELMTVLALVAGALFVAAVIAVIAFVVRFALKLLLLPFWLLGVLVKGFVFAGLALLALAMAPVLLLLLFIAVPFVALAGLIGFGAWAAA